MSSSMSGLPLILIATFAILAAMIVATAIVVVILMLLRRPETGSSIAPRGTAAGTATDEADRSTGGVP